MFQVQIRQCGKSFNRKWLFRHTDLDMHSGEKWALLGPNGSGKSTLSLMLAAQVYPTEGTVQWFADGRLLEPDKVHRMVALASPAMELPSEYSVTEIMAFHQRMKPMKMQYPAELLAELCAFDRAGMTNPLLNFSSGMKQRVKLCLAAFSDTPLLIFDEPMTNLDEAGIELFGFLLKEYSTDRLLVIASNRVEEYRECNREFRLGAKTEMEK